MYLPFMHTHCVPFSPIPSSDSFILLRGGRWLVVSNSTTVRRLLWVTLILLVPSGNKLFQHVHKCTHILAVSFCVKSVCNLRWLWLYSTQYMKFWTPYPSLHYPICMILLALGMPWHAMAKHSIHVMHVLISYKWWLLLHQSGFI